MKGIGSEHRRGCWGLEAGTGEFGTEVWMAAPGGSMQGTEEQRQRGKEGDGSLVF
jgi:hypothetical protein